MKKLKRARRVAFTNFPYSHVYKRLSKSIKYAIEPVLIGTIGTSFLWNFFSNFGKHLFTAKISYLYSHFVNALQISMIWEKASSTGLFVELISMWNHQNQNFNRYPFPAFRYSFISRVFQSRTLSELSSSVTNFSFSLCIYFSTP